MSVTFSSRCIQEANLGAGFIAEHKTFCASLNGGNALCEEPVEFHVRISYFCGNMCGKHKDKFVSRHREAAVTEPIFLEVQAPNKRSGPVGVGSTRPDLYIP